ncbi:MAG TPA: cupredoxin domain-containing protein [Caulobacteraceae bacterium]|jgi:plastocyanin
MNLRQIRLAAALVLLAGGAFAAQPRPASVALTLKDHRFSPATVTVPAGVPVRITLTNLDGATEEFDSDDLLVEERVTPHEKLTFTVGPLKPGAYHFMGEFHAATAQGVVTAATAPGG